MSNLENTSTTEKNERKPFSWEVNSLIFNVIENNSSNNKEKKESFSKIINHSVNLDLFRNIWIKPINNQWKKIISIKWNKNVMELSDNEKFKKIDL